MGTAGNVGISAPTIERLHSRIDSFSITDNRCWNWTGGKSDGYGTIMHNGTVRKSSRVMWMVMLGNIPAGKPEMIVEWPGEDLRDAEWAGPLPVPEEGE